MLGRGEENRRSGALRKRVVLAIRRKADHFSTPSKIYEVLTDRVPRLQHPFRKGLIDDRHTRCIQGIVHGKLTPRKQLCPRCCKPAR